MHIHEVLSVILHCKTKYCCRMTSQIISTTSGTLTSCTPLSRVDLFREEEVSKGTGSERFSPRRISSFKNTWRPHQHTVYWSNSKLAQKKGLQFLSNTITRNRSLQHIARYAWRLRRSFTTKYTNLQGCFELY